MRGTATAAGTDIGKLVQELYVGVAHGDVGRVPAALSRDVAWNEAGGTSYAS